MNRMAKTEAVKKLPPGVRPEDLTPDPNMSAEERARRKRFAEKAMALFGKIQLDIDIDEIRGRNRN
jgi:hypothetical protein